MPDETVPGDTPQDAQDNAETTPPLLLPDDAAGPHAEPQGGPPTPDGSGQHPFDSEAAPGCATSALGLPVSRWDTVVLILMVVAADVCLYDHPGGNGMAALLLVAAIGLLSLAPAGAWGANPLPLMTVLLVAAASVWHAWWALPLVGTVALFAFAVKLRRPDWRAAEILLVAPRTALLAPFRLLGHCVLSTCRPAEPEGPEPRRRRFPLRVVLVPLLVTVFFILIFVAANPVVEQLVRDVSDRLGKWLEALGDIFTLTRTVFWLFWLLLFAGLIRPVVKSWLADVLAKDGEGLGAPGGAAPDRANYATALATLVSVNLLFLAFNALDSVFLYFRAALPAGITFSEYSHRGCFWLTMGLLLSTVVIGVVFRNRLNFHPGANALRLLSYVWAAQNGVLAAGALRRLQMYIDYNGLTRLRIVGLYGVLLVAVGLALMVWKVRRAKNFMWLVRRDALAFWVALIVLALTPRDLICWRYNVAQVMSGNLRPLAVLHAPTMTPISPEGLPCLIPLLDYEHKEGEDKEATETRIRRGIAQLLGRRLIRLRGSRPRHWTEWQASHTWALGKLQSVSRRLDLTERDPRQRGEAEESLRGFARQWY